MPIEFRCPVCSKLLRTPDESAGKQAKCPQCGTVADVPGGDSPATPDLGSATPDLGPATPFAPPSEPATTNPYQVGVDSKQPIASVDGTGELTHERFTFDDMLSSAWSLFTKNIGPMLILGLVVFGIGFGIGMVGQVVLMAAQATGDLTIIVAANILQQLFSLLAQIWIQLGAVKYILKLLRHGQVEVGEFFSVGPYYLRGFLVQIIVVAIVLVVLGVCALPAVAIFFTQGQAGVEADPIAMIVAVSIGVIVWLTVQTLILLRFFFANQFIVDRDSSALEAISQSANFMQGNKLTAFLGMVVIGVIGMIFVICTCLIGAIFLQVVAVPFWTTSVSLCYLIATGQIRSGTTNIAPIKPELEGGGRPFA